MASTKVFLCLAILAVSQIFGTNANQYFNNGRCVDLLGDSSCLKNMDRWKDFCTQRSATRLCTVTCGACDVDFSNPSEAAAYYKKKEDEYMVYANIMRKNFAPGYGSGK